MRIKFIWVTVVAAGVLLLAGCCRRNKISITEEHDNETIPITVGVGSAGSKAIINDNEQSDRIWNMYQQCYTDQGRTGGFGVYGCKTVKRNGSNVTTNLFDNDRVFPEDEDLPHDKPETFNWIYTPTRFWDLTASYQFVGYWPYVNKQDESVGNNNFTRPSTTYVALDFNEDNNTRVVYLRNVPNWQKVDGTEDDYMTATRTGSYGVEFPTGKVNFRFEHILSQLVIKAYYTGKDLEEKTVVENDVSHKEFGGGVKINGIKLTKSDENNKVLNGTEVENAPLAISTDFKHGYTDDFASQATGNNSYNIAANTIDWADEYTLMPKVAQNGVLIPYKDELDDKFYQWKSTAEEEVGGPELIGSWLMIPHKWQDLILSVLYDKGGNPVSSSFDESTPAVHVTVGEEHYGYVTQPGKTYTITLVFDTSGGGLSVMDVAIENWSSYNVSREVYNW